MAERRVLETQADLELWVKYLHGRKLPQTVSSEDGRDRSLEQNRTQFLWAKEAAEQRGDMDHVEVRCEWKLIYGVPILRAENDEWRDTYDDVLKSLPYEKKLKVMRIIPVTSEMTVKQMVQYLDTIQRECAEQGIRLTDPERKAA